MWGTPLDTGTAAGTLRATAYRGPLYFDAAAVAADTLSPTNAPAVEGAYASDSGAVRVAATLR